MQILTGFGIYYGFVTIKLFCESKNLVDPNKNDKAYVPLYRKTSDKSISSKQACNGNCQSCNNIWFDEDTAKNIPAVSSSYIWPVLMRTKIFMIYLKVTRWHKWGLYGFALNGIWHKINF